MEPIYLGDLVPSIASSKKIIEKYYKGIKKGDFMKNLLADFLITLIGKYAYYKNTFALAYWIREWRKCLYKSPSIDEYVKFVEWKVKDYKLSDSDKRIIESILFYESE